MRGPLKADPVTLASGVVTAALGALLLLDAEGAGSLPLGWMAVVLTAAVGAILVLSGLSNGGNGRHDSDK